MRAVVTHPAARRLELGERVTGDHPIELDVAEGADWSGSRPHQQLGPRRWAPRPPWRGPPARWPDRPWARRRLSVGALPVERLDEQVDRAAAGEADGEGVVVGVAERDDARRRLPASTASASDTTAPSTQPPLTLPATSPSSLTAMAAPGHAVPTRRRRRRVPRSVVHARFPAGPRGVLTRAPTPPVDAQAARSGRTSCSAFVRTRVRTFEASRQRVTLHELVDVGERGRHAAGEWRVARRHLERIDPHDAVGYAPRRCICSASSSGSPRSHPSERITTSAPPCHAAHAPAVVEPGETFAETGSARPVGDPRRSLGEGDVGVVAPSSRVIRVSRVPRANASTRRRPATAACTKRSNARAYGSIDPDTSSRSTRRR